MRPLYKRVPLALASALLLAGCVGDGDDVVTEPAQPALGGSMFQRYVSLGNSITAGFQSGGLTAAGQRNAYPVLLAERARAPFGVPLIANPGCPVPFAGPLTGTPAGAPACALRDPSSAPFTQNFGVPGARLGDALVIPASPSTRQLNTLLVGNRSQVQAMRDAQATFVSVWLGNNDALGAATDGRLGPLTAGADSNLTRLSVFQSQLNQLVTHIQATAPQGAMLIGVVDPVVAVPLLQPGAYFFLARDTAGKYNNKPVNDNCSPLTGLGTPNPLSANFVSFQIVGDAAFAEINCDPNFYPSNDPRFSRYVLDVAEATVIRTRVAQFNAALSAAATANGWLYVDPNAVLAPFITETTLAGRFDRVRKCQLLATATPATIQTAVLNSCPVTGPTSAPGFFGSLISFDGVHPSTEAHRILARDFATRINTRYGLRLLTN